MTAQPTAPETWSIQRQLDELGRPPRIGDLIYINHIACRITAIEPVGFEAPDKFEISFAAEATR